jgi:beta-glucanase (GH16 family)
MKLPWVQKDGKQWGFHSAFWTWCPDSNCKNAGEIDIFEMLGWYSSNTVTTNVHTCYPCIKCEPNYFQAHTLSNFDYRGWHTYAVEWDSKLITWYVDGVIIRRIENKNLDYINQHSIVDSVEIILGVGVSDRNQNLPPTSPPFKEYMFVDYVKVYSLKCDKNTVVTVIPNFKTYCYAVKKSITLGSNTIIPQRDNISLRATDFIQLNPGFEVPLNTELFLGVNPCDGPNVLCNTIPEQ